MNRKYRRIYRIIGIALLIIAVGFISNDQLRRMGNRISEEYLQELISTESKGLYQLDFGDIDLNIFRKSIIIQNIELYATPENRDDSINVKNIYEAKIGEVKISLESIIRIYTNRELVVDGIEIIDPFVFMTKINPDKAALKFGRETGALYDIISKYLELLQINYFKVKSGTVKHSPSNFNLKAIDFDLKNFTVAQKRRRKKIFYSEAIHLGINQQSILLPDSIHELSFDGFELSTKDSLLNFKNFKILPRKGINPSEVFQKKNQNVYDIYVPTLELKGVNYLKAYEDNFLVVEQVNIPKPKIKIQSVLKSKKQDTEQAENSIGSSLLALFDLIKIKDLRIEEGGLNLTLQGDNQQRFLSNNISIALFNIELDSTQRELQNIVQYFENASIEINDYDYVLPDNLHTIKFKKLNYNTKDSTLVVKNLEIKPSRGLDDSTLTQFTLKLPLLEMEGIAHRDIYYNDKIELRKLALSDSKITITPPYLKTTDGQVNIITPEGLYEMISQFLSEIKLEQFSLHNFELSVGEIFTGKALNVASHFLTIDSTLQSWHKIAATTIINGQDLVYNIKNSQIKVSAFESKNNLHSLGLTKLNINYEGLSKEIKMDYLSFRGVELDSILYRKKLNIDSITLSRPQIKFSYKDVKQQLGKTNDLKFPNKPINILMKNGTLNYQIDEFRNLSIADYDIELNYQNEIELFQVFAKDLKIVDKKLMHQISFNNIKLPKNENILSLHGIQIMPNDVNDSLSIDIKIPEIKFTNFNKYALIQNNRFEADSMLGRITQLNYKGFSNFNEQFGINTDGKNDSKFSFAVENAIVELTGSSIILFDIKNEMSQILSAGSKLNLRKINFPKKENKNLFFAEDFTLSNQDFNFYSAKNDTTSIQDLNYSSLGKKGAIQQFSFHGADSTTSLEISGITVGNVKIDDYVQNNSVDIQNLSSEKTTLNFRISEQEKEMLPQSIKLPFSELKIQEIFSKDINIQVFHEEKGRDYFVREANLFVNTLVLDSTLNPIEIHHHINSLVLSGKNYTENFGKQYTVSANDYTFRYPESVFEASNISMRSKYDRFEYSNTIEFQNEWFKFDLKTLKLNQLNIDSLLSKQKFIVNKLELEKGDLTVFRDLNIPHNTDKKVPMPQKLLSELAFAFSIDTIFVNSDIHIHLVPKESLGIGTMTINVESANIFNMRTSHFNNETPMILQATGKLNGKANFQTKVIFPTSSEKSEFHFMGNIGAMDLKTLNEMLIPIGALEVRSGISEEININFKGNDEYAQGLIEFRYKNLKIDVLDRETYQSKGLGNNLKTIFANSFVVSSKNPRWLKLQKGNIFYERIKSRSIFNFWAKALLSGAVSSIGINKSKEEAKAYYKEKNDGLDEE